MIVSFSVQNFRSIRDKVTLDFRATSDKHQEEYFVVTFSKPKLRVLKMAMIYGANASGKTSVLSALEFLGYMVLFPLQDKNIELHIPHFALDRDKPSLFEIDFIQGNVLYEYRLELDRSKVFYESLSYYPKGKRAEIFERKLDNNDLYGYKWSDKLFMKSTRDYMELTIQNQAILARIASIEDFSPLQDAHNWFRNKLQSLLRPNDNLLNFANQFLINQPINREAVKQYILAFLNKADFWINDIDIEEYDVDPSQVPEHLRNNLNPPFPNAKPSFKRYDFGFVHKLDKGSFTLDMAEESSGTRRFYGFGAILMNLIFQEVVMPIDEIESSLHNDLLFHFIAMFLKNSKQGQLIFTSHNTALLNEKEIIRRDCIWITDRKTDGSTELTPVSDYPVRKEHSLASLFKKGLIGGKPNLGSINLEDIDEQAQKTEH